MTIRSLPWSGALLLVLVAPAGAQNCSRTSTGLLPLTDLGTSKYQGFAGGLYGGGSNALPALHLAAGLAESGAVAPLDKSGKPDAQNGRIVLISIGMSNTTQEFSTWLHMSDRDPKRRGTVRVVDCAQGGQDARKIQDPNALYWTVCMQRIAAAGLSAQQVQVAWVKQAIARPAKGFPASSVELQTFLVKICQNLKAKFPKIRIAYLSSRIYAGYATTQLNPEPYSYESGFGVRWTIEQQMKGDAGLNWDPKKGAVRAPWLAWGPYLWADGLKGRKIDKLVWTCADFSSDGTHPSASGRQKVADLLDLHFKNDVTARTWYLGPGGGGKAAVLPYGAGCPGSRGVLGVRSNGVPILGTSFKLGIVNARPSSPAVLLLSAAKASLALDPRCTLLLDPTKSLMALVLATNNVGNAVVSLATPNEQQLVGLSVFTQFLVLDPAAPGLRLFGGAALSQGVELLIGWL
ncbi:MAG: hypothetical protein ACE5F1_06545 [Planctomycetota bacterium]